MMLLVRWRDYDRVIGLNEVRQGESHEGRLHSFVCDGHGDIVAMVLEGSRFVPVLADQLEFWDHPEDLKGLLQRHGGDMLDWIRAQQRNGALR